MPKGRVAVASGWTFGHVEVRSAAAPILPTRPASRLTRGRPKKGPDLPAEIIRAAERELHAASIICRQIRASACPRHPTPGRRSAGSRRRRARFIGRGSRGPVAWRPGSGGASASSVRHRRPSIWWPSSEEMISSLPGFRLPSSRLRPDSGSQQTLRWREVDSNPRSPVTVSSVHLGRARRDHAPSWSPGTPIVPRRRARRAICGMPEAPSHGQSWSSRSASATSSIWRLGNVW